MIGAALFNVTLGSRVIGVALFKVTPGSRVIEIAFCVTQGSGDYWLLPHKNCCGDRTAQW